MERVRVSRISGNGVVHVDVIKGERLDVSCPKTTAVIRVHNGGKLTAVHTFTGVSRMLWKPTKEIN